jgi:hypothetical protein
MTGQMNREKPRQTLTPGRMFMVATLCAPLLAAACGSVSNGKGTGGAGGTVTDAGSDLAQGSGSGGSGSGGVVGTGGSGTGGASSMGGAAGSIADASVDQVKADAADASVLPTSCAQIKQQNSAAASGVFAISPLGTASQNVFCEMTVDNGGWTAFYIGDNGTPAAHFENAADQCPDPVNRCLRRLPATLDTTHDFAVKCGASVVKFKLGALSLDYLKNGLEHNWQPLTNAVTIDTALVGKANLVGALWTGDPTAGNNLGWIVAGDQNTTTTTFANGYSTNASWNFCNGATDNTSRVMLFYR